MGVGGALKANCKKKVRVIRRGGKVGRSSCSAVHDHPDQFCKRTDEKETNIRLVAENLAETSSNYSMRC